MRQAGLLLLIVLAVVTTAPAVAAPGADLDQPLVSDVMRTAMAFITPRILDPTPMPQLAVWGLAGLGALDPQIGVGLTARDKAPVLLTVTGAAGRLLLQRPAPGPDDAPGWGIAIGQALRAGWDASAAVRAAGTDGVIRSFFDELFSHMDMYSRYAPPRAADAERARRVGRAGVGVTPEASGGGFIVGAVQPDSPAALAGVRPGERILAIGDRSTQTADLAALNERLAGPEGSTVSLALRDPHDQVHIFDLERALVPPETVTARRDGDMLVLQISSFSRDTGVRLAQELIRGLSEPRPYRGVVIDLRDNRGGVLSQAVAVAAMLQASGVVAVTQGRDPAAAHVFLADGRDLAEGLPVVVLVDGGSASAAEIVAASLADQRRAVVVGSSTLGKGLVQAIAPLPDGGELIVTWSRVLAPLGWPLQGLGVLPQVCTSLGQDVLDRQLTQLLRGAQPMQTALDQARAARAPLSPAEVLRLRAPCPAARGHSADIGAARYLIDTPDAYRTALLRVQFSGLPEPLAEQGLTPRAAVGD